MLHLYRERGLSLARGIGQVTYRSELEFDERFNSLVGMTSVKDELRKRVIGQEEPLVAVSNAVRRARAGLQDPNRPIGSFLFLGPTGVGKTELARTLADFLFDDEHRSSHRAQRRTLAPPVGNAHGKRRESGHR